MEQRRRGRRTRAERLMVRRWPGPKPGEALFFLNSFDTRGLRPYRRRGRVGGRPPVLNLRMIIGWYGVLR